MRKWAYGLTADEWLHLAAEGEDSEIAPCCGNISQIREILNTLATCQASYDGWLRKAVGKELLESLEADGDGHNLQDRETFPLLWRVIDGIGQETGEITN